MKLDARTVAALALAAGKSDVIYFDDDLPGFGLRLRAGGKRSYVAQFRVAGGRQRRVKVGDAAVLTVEQARAAARKLLAAVTLGDDPQSERKRGREAARVTLRSVIVDYLAAREGKLRPRTEFETTRYLVGPYFRALHPMPIEQIERRHVAAQIMRIERESGVAAAMAARSALSALFLWSMQTGLVEHNPMIGAYKPAAQPSRDRVLSNAELTAIWRESGDGDFGLIVRLLILTGCRRSEIGGVAWDEFDREAGTWTLPAARSKNGRAHVLPLPPLAWSIIDSIPRLGRDHLFGARGYSGWHPAKAALDERLGGTVGPWVVHDLRRSTATKLADIGVQPHVIEAVLNHRRRGVAGIYNRSTYQREVAAALAMWADHVRVLVEGDERNLIMQKKT